MEVRESWAYRARAVDSLVEACVMRIGTSKPARVLVKFVDDEFEGKQEWVPPARLKVPWSGVGEFTSWEAKWNAVIEASDVRGTAEDYAASRVFDSQIRWELASKEHNRAAGVAKIRDVPGLADELGLDPAVLREDRLAFVDEGILVVPWRVAHVIARRAAELHADEVLADLESDEAEQAQRTAYGEYRPADRNFREHIIKPEFFIELDNEPHSRPHRELLRTWCGREAAERRDELRALRAEVRRIGALTSTAIDELRRAGAPRAADRIESELGISVEELRHLARYQDSGG